MSRLTVKVGQDYFTSGACGLRSWTDVLKNRLVYKLGQYEELGEPEELVKVVRCEECANYKQHASINGGVCDYLDTNMNSKGYCSFGRKKEAQP